jgi:pre-rRNA-processing protein TSR4
MVPVKVGLCLCIFFLAPQDMQCMDELFQRALLISNREGLEQEDEGAGGLVQDVADLRVKSPEEVGGQDIVVEEEEEEEEDDTLVGLGFVQPVEQAWKVSRHHFPSKVGGTPAWLDPINLPYGKQVLCGICDNPLQFLLQVYAPLEDQPEAFHRTLYVFICPNMACLQQDQHHQCKQPAEKPCRSIRVFRSQLPRNNSFYSYSPPNPDGQDSPSCDGVALCTWCGAWKGHKACAACKQTRYCSRNHQIEHWRAGHSGFCRQVQAAKSAGHPEPGSTKDVESVKVEAGELMPEDLHEPYKKNLPGIACAASDKLWPEFELVVDEEYNYEAEDNDRSNPGPQMEAGQSRAKQLLDEYERRRKAGEEFSASDLQEVQEASQEQQHWVSFQARISRAPEQVLRYCRSQDAKPLWPLLDGQPKKSTDIQPCSHCGGPRNFELQVLPQLLYFLRVKNEPSSLDWATITVFSCTASCTSGVSNGYAEEFAWVQLAA